MNPKYIKLDNGEFLCNFITMQGHASTVEVAVVLKNFDGRNRYRKKYYMQVDESDERPVLSDGVWCDTYQEAMTGAMEQARELIYFTII